MTLPWRSNTTEDISTEADSRYETPGGAQAKVDDAIRNLPPGFVGAEQLDPSLLAQYGDIAINAKFETLDNQLSDTTFLTFYVDSINGNDSNTGLTNYSAFKTIKKATDNIPGVSLTRCEIIVLPGVYNEDVIIERKLRCQTIYIHGETGDSSLYSVKSFFINEVSNRVGIANFTVTTTDEHSVMITYCNRTNIENCVINGLSSVKHGIYLYDANARIKNVSIYNRNLAIACEDRSWAYIENSIGSNNQVGIYSGIGSIVTVFNNAINGTLQEQEVYGGQIFGNTPFVYLRSGNLTVNPLQEELNIPLTTVVEDSYGLKSGNSILIKKTGWYSINLLSTLDSLKNIDRANISVWKNNQKLTERQLIGIGDFNVTFLTLDDQQYFEFGDSITFKLYQTGTGPINVFNTQIRMTCIGKRR